MATTADSTPPNTKSGHPIAPDLTWTTIDPFPTPEQARQRERDRRAALAHWNAERDNVAIEWQEAGAGTARQRDAEALLDHIDAVRAALATDMVSPVRLSALERSLAAFRHAPQAALARLIPELEGPAQHGRRFRGRTRDAVRREIEEYLVTQPGAQAPEVLAHLRGLAARGNHPVILAVGAVGFERAARRYQEALGRSLPQPFPDRSVVWEWEPGRKGTRRPRRPHILSYLELRGLLKRVRRNLRVSPN